MLAECVHSVADTCNQGLLLLGGKRARREATAEHPFGYGRDRYFYSFVVALLLFSLGSVFAIYEGIHKLSTPRRSPRYRRGRHPRRRDRPGDVQLPDRDRGVAPAQGRRARGGGSSASPSARAAGRAARGPRRARRAWSSPCSASGSPSLTGDPVWDAIGTICIGVLLGIIAVILIVEMKSLLIGEGAAPPVLAIIVRESAGDVAAGDPHQHAVPRARGAARRREDRAAAGAADGEGRAGDRRRRAAGPRHGAPRRG